MLIHIAKPNASVYTEYTFSFLKIITLVKRRQFLSKKKKIDGLADRRTEKYTS